MGAEGYERERGFLAVHSRLDRTLSSSRFFSVLQASTSSSGDVSPLSKEGPFNYIGNRFLSTYPPSCSSFSSMKESQGRGRTAEEKEEEEEDGKSAARSDRARS